MTTNNITIYSSILHFRKEMKYIKSKLLHSRQQYNSFYSYDPTTEEFQHRSIKLKGRKLNLRTASASWENGALDKLGAGTIDAQVDLVQLVIARFISIALDIWCITNTFFDRILNAR